MKVTNVESPVFCRPQLNVVNRRTSLVSESLGFLCKFAHSVVLCSMYMHVEITNECLVHILNYISPRMQYIMYISSLTRIRGTVHNFPN